MTITNPGPVSFAADGVALAAAEATAPCTLTPGKREHPSRHGRGDFSRTRKRSRGECMAKAEPKTRTLMEWRKARGLSVQAFADALGVSIAQASNYLYGRGEPLVSRALKIAEVLGVRVEDVQWNVDPRTLDLPAMPPGEPGVVTPEQVEVAKVWVSRGVKKADVARELGISRTGLYKYL